MACNEGLWCHAKCTFQVMFLYFTLNMQTDEISWQHGTPVVMHSICIYFPNSHGSLSKQSLKKERERDKKIRSRYIVQFSSAFLLWTKSHAISRFPSDPNYVSIFSAKCVQFSYSSAGARTSVSTYIVLLLYTHISVHVCELLVGTYIVCVCSIYTHTHAYKMR